MWFNTILVLATAITGIVWLLDWFWLRRRRTEDAKPNIVIDFCVSLFPVIFLVFIVRSFIVEPFRIPSGSMIPTLHVGDFILVDKFAYGLRCPIGRCRLIGNGVPHRGDVAVFAYPGNPSLAHDPNLGEDFIKRIVAVPGDHVAYVDKVLSINGEPAKIQPDGDYPMSDGDYRRELETLSGVKHSIILNPDRPPQDFEFTVPLGQYFAMGDNRDGSYDSRYWGTVPDADLLGKAFFIWMSWNETTFRPVFKRFGMVIH